MFNYCPKCKKAVAPDWNCCPFCRYEFQEVGSAVEEEINGGSALDDALENLMGLANEEKNRRVKENKLRTSIIRGLYDEAKEICNELIENDPMDKVGYIGLIRIASKNYKEFESAEIAEQIRIAEEIFGGEEELFSDSEYEKYIIARKRYFEEKERKRIEAERAEAERKRIKAEQAEAERKRVETEKAEANRLYRADRYQEALPLCLKFAENGDVDFSCKTGNCYNFVKDYEKAVYWYKKSAEKGNAKAQYNLGLCYKNGRGIAKDHEKAMYWFKKAAEQGDLDAQKRLMQIEAERAEAERKRIEAERAEEERKRIEAEKAEAERRAKAKELYKSGRYQEALPLCLEFAEKGEIDFCFRTGYCYAFIKNYEQAFRWHTEAAEQGDADAQCNLGWHYENGWGVTKDYEKTVYWYTKAAEQGCAAAQNHLGVCYYNGEGVAKNDEKARYWLKKAAEQGDADAQNRLKCMDEKEAEEARIRALYNIEDGILKECRDKGIIHADIPNGVTQIGKKAFEGCKSLTSITIPNSVTSIGDFAFDCCNSLKSITIPNSVTSIGVGAFWGCESFTGIDIPNSVTSIGSSAFFGCTSLTSVNIPNSVMEIGSCAFQNCKSLTSIEILNGVTSIEEGVFCDCTSLTSITIPNGVTSIGEGAFYGCKSLTSIIIPNRVTSIGKQAFVGCKSLSSITIPSSVTSIGVWAFDRCSSLASVTIPSECECDNVAFPYGCKIIKR